MKRRAQRRAALICSCLVASACAPGWRQPSAVDPGGGAIERWRAGGAAALEAWARREPAQAWSAFDRLLRDLLEPPGGSGYAEREQVAAALARSWRAAGEAKPQRWLAATAALAPDERGRHRALWRRLDRAVRAGSAAQLAALRDEARAAGALRLELTALRHLAQQAYHRDDVEALRRWLAAAQALQRQAATPMQQADFLRYAGWLRFYEDDLRGALELGQRAVRIDRAVRHRVGLVGDLYAVASFCDELGLLEQAALHLADMQQLALAIGHRTGAMAALADQSLLYRRIGDLERARSLLHQARAQSGGLREDRNRSILLARLAYLEVEAGRWSQARSWLLAAWHLERRARRTGELATLEARLAVIAAELGEEATSLRFQARALEHMEASPAPSDRAAVLLEVARAQMRSGRPRQARALLQRAERHLVADPAPLLSREILFRRGQVALACADPVAAEREFARAATSAESSWQLAGSGDLRIALLATVQEIYGAWIERLAARHRAAQALVVAERGRARSFLERLGRQSNLAALPIAGVEELTEALHEGDLLLVFRCDPQVTWRWSVTPRGAALHRIATPAARLAQWVEGARQGNRSDRERLSDLLLGRLAAQLDATERLILVADGPLLRLPFGALPWRERLLIEGCALTHAPSASAWVRWGEAQAPSWGGTVLVVGDPIGDLPGARAEARALARRFPDARLLIGAQATPAAVLSALRDASLAHVAAHYRIELRNPYQSQLLLARAAGRGPAPLSMATLGQRSLPRRPLIVLSSCSAAGGRFHPGEGVVGGFRALFEAGASGVIAPLQPVADLSTARLMRDLAAELEAGHPPDRALARAQRAALARGGREPSRDWANFIFIGAGA